MRCEFHTCEIGIAFGFTASAAASSSKKFPNKVLSDGPAPMHFFLFFVIRIVVTVIGMLAVDLINENEKEVDVDVESL